MNPRLNLTVKRFDSRHRSQTLVQLLRRRALDQPDQIGYTFLLDGDETKEISLSYRELDEAARLIAARILTYATAGDRILLLYPPGLEYIQAFFGCLYAGVIAVPAYPPRRNRTLARLQAIASDSQATLALTTSTTLVRVSQMFASDPALRSLRWLATDDLKLETVAEWQETELKSEMLAFLQYTSGSTGTPKGVMLTHENLLYNAQLVYEACEHTPAEKYMSWLPTFHDMGFMAGILQPLYGGFPVTLMSSSAFLQSPVRWLQAITRYRSTVSGGPNFAYDLCLRKINREQLEQLDLSSWSVAFNGAEPVRHETLKRFSEVFAKCGFRHEAFYPCYGLAEATLMVSGGRKSEAFRSVTFNADFLKAGRIAEDLPDNRDGRTLVSCGKTMAGQKIAIVNLETLVECPAGEIGEIWVTGSSVAKGYWNRPDDTEQTFNAYLADILEGRFLRTGDLGALRDGELFVTGRLKDLIIIRGLNHYPQDIELTVEKCHPALRAGCGAAFSVDVEGEERLAIVQEVDRHWSDFDALQQGIMQAVADEHELQVHSLTLIRHGTISKTSSGKIQRRACRKRLLEGTLDVVAEWQVPANKDELAPAPLRPIVRDKGDVEEWLLSLLASRLGVEASTLYLHQPLSSYGLDSLAAIELKHNIESTLAVDLSFTNFFENSGISDLAEIIFVQLKHAPESTKLPSPAPATEASGEFSLSFGQRSLWFMHEIAPESAAYNIVLAAHIPSALDVPALRRAFERLIDRHASLRTSFIIKAGKPVQRIRECADLNFQHTDASKWDDALLKDLLLQEAHHTFNLETDSLMRVRLFTRSEQDQVLLLVLHHIIADSWSLAVLMHELGIAYSAEKRDEPAVLPPLDQQYTDYVRWQEEMLSSAVGERLWSYWRSELEGAVAPLNLPFDKPRPPVQTYSGSSIIFKLEKDLAAKLLALGRAHDATLYMTLLAAFQVLLHRYTQQTDVLVGSPTTGRNLASSANVLGYFVNPIVLRADLRGNPTFESFLEEVRRTCLRAFEHQDYPFALLVERLQPVRDPSAPPLFNVMFVLQQSHLLNQAGAALFAMGEPGARIDLAGLPLESFDLKQQIAQVNLTLTMVQAEEELVGSFQFNTDLFEGETIARFSRHFKNLLEAVVAEPSLCVSEIPLLDSSERRRILVEWNDTRLESQINYCLHHPFETQVERTPDRTALVSLEQELSYAELNRRSNQLAHHLRKLGVGPEVPVAICTKRTSEMIVGMLGILKAGGFYVPLDPAYPQERLWFMLNDSAVPVVLTQHSLLNILPPHEARIICLDSGWPMIALESEQNPVNEIVSENVAYVIYTSGSTGKPKGVSIRHGSAAILLRWSSDTFAERLAGTLASTSICFDISVFEIFAPLSVGGTIILGDDAMHLPALPAANRVTLINTVPSAMTQLVQMNGVPDSIRTVNLAGEALSTELVARVCESKAQVERVYNLYGPSEDTTYSTFAEVSREVGQAAPVGRPVANTEVYVLDRELQPVPVGVVGELYLGGAGLARGYQGQAALTAARFVPHPYGREGGGRLYRTGDLGRYRGDGVIEFVGRVDQQVKLRGYRIELGEIESVLRQHERVAEAVVVVRGEGAEKQLVGYVVAANGGSGELRVAELREYLSEQVPHYMIPGALVVLERLPLTANGKIDRRALPEVERRSGSGGEERERTETEIAVARIWEEVLGVEQVGLEDNFFELGGHSLLAMQVISRLREQFGVDLPLRLLLESQTVVALAVRVEAAVKDATAGSPSLAPITRTQRGAANPPLQIEKVMSESDVLIFPASYSQQRLWFLNQLEPESGAYNIPAALELSGDLKVQALAQALQAVVRRHEALRTRFAVQGGEPVQVISPDEELRLEVLNFDGREREWQQAEVARVMAVEAELPFDLAEGPLLRVKLVKLGGTEHVLVLVLHHIISDGWSMGVLVKELSYFYNQYAVDEAAPLAELEVQYADYAVWQREWLSGAVLEEQLSYWREQLGGAEGLLELPTDHVRPAVQSFRGANERVGLGAELTQGLKELSRRAGATLYMTLLAAFQVLLYRYTGAAEISVGTPVAGRSRREVEGLIGLFVNTLVIRNEVHGEESFLELLGRVREVTLAGYAHEEVPFEKVVEELRPERSLSHSPLFQVVFAWQVNVLPELQLAGVAVRQRQLRSETAKFDLTLQLEEAEGGVRGWLEYNTDLFAAESMKRLLGHYESLLWGVVRHTSQRLAELPLLGEQERRQLLEEWNQTRSAYPSRACIHELFAAQATTHADEVAVVCGEAALSYGELNRRANQLAHHLQRLGVGPEEVVGICMDGSLELVVGLLGILKAGGAYLPLDPSYPPKRLRFMVQDAGVRVVLTTKGLTPVTDETGVRLVYLDTGWETIAEESAAALENSSTADNLAYITYTSGSSGEPKGVGVVHRGVVRLVQQNSYAVLDEGEVFLHLAPLSFDASTFEIWGSLLNGARLVVMTAGPPSLMEIGAALEQYGVTTLWLTAGLFNVMVEERLAELRCLRQLLAGGDVLSMVHVERFLQEVRGCTLINGYGPTENTTFTCTYAMKGPMQFEASVPIGRAIANTEVYVLDRELQPVPVGVVGELYLGGAGLARGYQGQAALTAARFVPHPYGREGGGRLYRTGDLGRYRGDGVIEFVGRVDQQVKLRGYRIELGEIESVLRQHERVAEAVVVVRGEGAEKQLVGYVVAANGGSGELRVAELREYLSEQVPHYMIPGALVVLERLPLTANGKIDRRALPEVERRSGSGGEERERTETEIAVARIWEEVLGVEQVGLEDNFFELGGHSLLATRIVSRVRETFDVDLSLRTLFESQTIEALGRVIEEVKKNGKQTRAPAIRAVSRERYRSKAPVP